jgi:hypothetical protein
MLPSADGIARQGFFTFAVLHVQPFFVQFLKGKTVHCFQYLMQKVKLDLLPMLL